MTQEGFRINVGEPTDAMSPLIRFRGTVDSHQQTVRHVEGQEKPRLGVTFNFTDVTVIESREPYPFPIATIPIPYSDRSNTRWAAFTKSFRNLVPREDWADLEDPLTLLDGKEVEMYFGPATLRLPVQDENGANTGQWAEQEGTAWQLVAIEGYSGADEKGESLMDKVLNYADGKKDQDIYTWIYTAPELKSMSGYAQIVEAVAERKLLTSYLEAGVLTQDSEGVYHKNG